MKIKGWGIQPFNPLDHVINASSRKLQDPPDTNIPKYRLEASVPEVNFELNLPVKDTYIWVVFTNTGRSPLRNLAGEVDLPFLVQGGIPSVLRPGESFQLRLNFYPDEPNIYTEYLTLFNKDYVFRLVLKGIWQYVGLLYDGLARHNGKYYYGGGQGLKEFLFDGSEYFDGRYPFSGVKYRDNIFN